MNNKMRMSLPEYDEETYEYLNANYKIPSEVYSIELMAVAKAIPVAVDLQDEAYNLYVGQDIIHLRVPKASIEEWARANPYTIINRIILHHSNVCDCYLRAIPTTAYDKLLSSCDSLGSLFMKDFFAWQDGEICQI